MITCGIDKLKLRRLTKQLEQLGKKTATKILVDELKTTAKQTLARVKSLVPKDSGALRRSLSMKRVKKRRRYSVAFRLFFKPLKEQRQVKRGLVARILRRPAKTKTVNRFYGFAPEYGVRRGRGKQPAQAMIHKHGKAYAESLKDATYARIKKRLHQEWRK